MEDLNVYMVQSDGLESCVSKGRNIDVAIQDIVAMPALMQGIKGLVSAGFTKSLKYSQEKIKKAIKAKK